jgi:hypothetical protein
MRQAPSIERLARIDLADAELLARRQRRDNE